MHWLHPKPKSQLHNWRASGIIQSGRVPPREDGVESSEIHPIWSAGIRGEGQIVGCGDSGIDVDSCFFFDSRVNFKDGITVRKQSVQQLLLNVNMKPSTLNPGVVVAAAVTDCSVIQ